MVDDMKVERVGGEAAHDVALAVVALGRAVRVRQMGGVAPEVLGVLLGDQLVAHDAQDHEALLVALSVIELSIRRNVQVVDALFAVVAAKVIDVEVQIAGLDAFVEHHLTARGATGDGLGASGRRERQREKREYQHAWGHGRSRPSAASSARMRMRSAIAFNTVIPSAVRHAPNRSAPAISSTATAT